MVIDTRIEVRYVTTEDECAILRTGLRGLLKLVPTDFLVEDGAGVGVWLVAIREDVPTRHSSTLDVFANCRYKGQKVGVPNRINLCALSKAVVADG